MSLIGNKRKTLLWKHLTENELDDLCARLIFAHIPSPYGQLPTCTNKIGSDLTPFGNIGNNTLIPETGQDL